MAARNTPERQAAAGKGRAGRAADPAKRTKAPPSTRAQTSWDPVADWYTSWVGEEGGRHHRELTVPAALELLAPRRGESIIDVGAGPGVLAPFIAGAGAHYTGVDISGKLLAFARQHHGSHGRFLRADARDLPRAPELRAGAFQAAVFLLSIQDMDPLSAVLDSVAWALDDEGRVVLLMTHPCFRVPRLSGWGWDERRRLQYRRVDRYLTPLPVPVETVGGPPGGAPVLRFHRPLNEYINGLAEHGFLVDHLQEIPTYYEVRTGGPRARAENFALQEIPVFLALRARRPPRYASG